MLVDVDVVRAAVLEAISRIGELEPECRFSPEELKKYADDKSVLIGLFLKGYDAALEKAIDRKIQEALSKRID